MSIAIQTQHFLPGYFMRFIKNGSDSLESFSDDQIEDLIKSNDALDQEEAKWIKEEIEEEERKARERKSATKPFRRLKKTPLEIINRSLFLVFLFSFLFSFISVYGVNRWWFFWYVLSSFSCILYTPNRKALKELIDAWPNIEDLIKSWQE